VPFFAFGPVDRVVGYGTDLLTYDTSNARENDLRAPVKWLQCVGEPLFVFEGTEKPSNIACWKILQAASTNPLIHFYPLKGKTHFSGLAPTNKVIAAKILDDTGSSTNITFSNQDLDKLP